MSDQAFHTNTDSTDLPQRLGTVVAVQANFYQVRLENSPEKPFLLCTRRTRLKKIGQQVLVGDRVVVSDPLNSDERGAIIEVLPRQSEFKRPQVANVDQVLLVFALEEPTLDPWQLSRRLVMAESSGLDLCLCLNKTDLVTPEKQQQWRERLVSWGYQPLFFSVANHTGIEEIKQNLKDKITILAGLSGVGKSSLINVLLPGVNLRVGNVSGKLRQGAHTTRHVELFELADGGFIVDSPGFNQLDIACPSVDLICYFPEARKMLASGSCQFSDCSHLLEPNCVVRGDWERYEHYLSFLEEAKAKEQEEGKAKDESNLKLKIKSEGKRTLEPKLESKKYRRTSRRQTNQNVEEAFDE